MSNNCLKRSHSPSSPNSESPDPDRTLDFPSQIASTSSPPKKPRFSIDQLLEERESKNSEENDKSLVKPEIDELLEGKEDIALPVRPQKLKRSHLLKNPLSEHRFGKGKGFRLENLQCRLEGAELWKSFYDLETEMIITKSGRRMFPTVKVSLFNMEADALYYVFLDVIRVDSKRYRYIYGKSSWQAAGKAEPEHKNRLHLHPDSPFTGEQLQKQVINFEKAKLTNNEVDRAGHLVLTSMHKYQPRIHVVIRDKSNPLEPNKANLENEEYRTFEFPETQFMAVTAYQNQLITKLKIEKNPFAKGFRDPSGRSPDYEGESRLDAFPIISPNGTPNILLHNLLLQQQLEFMKGPCPMNNNQLDFARMMQQQRFYQDFCRVIQDQLSLPSPIKPPAGLLTPELLGHQAITPTKSSKSPLPCT
ncbi:hypothetical protein WR25_11131 isoform A [Diploscapter pachys]|uniref:T-box domain-containing protein n=1 Tax=Diploscapter pachys TaxID=2018661 RepID=A0A2A2JJ60_9BILA|nr:hypothetical protein WR25_11131 isoform A [Diploscapter pachys]